MRTLGVDIGSRTIGIVSLMNGEINDSKVIDSGHNPIQLAKEVVKELGDHELVVATGYGRHSAKKSFAQEIVTEIKAHGLGASYIFPNCRTIIDIGGQDSKVIKVSETGNVIDFLMNDKCAAGTGKFLETMQRALSLSLEDLVTRAQNASQSITINSMCTVFAESEVISLLNREVPIDNIALGLVNSICQRVAGMVSRIGSEDDIVFTGGVARIPGINKFLEQTIGQGTIHVPEEPQIAGALGAALYGKQILEKSTA